jgi:putative two-component system response regulator
MMSRRVSVMLPNEDRTCLTIVRQIGLDDESARRIRVPIGSATSGRVFASGRAIVVNGIDETRWDERDYESPFFASVPMLSAPLGCVGDVVGVLNVTERIGQRPFEPHELEYVELLAGIAGPAMRAAMNAQARDEARDLIVVAMAKLAEHRDRDTARHVERVTLYTELLAGELRGRPEFQASIDDEFMRDLRRAVPLHDIGKVAIPDHILLKPGKLTDAEMAIMRTHTQVGAEALQAVIDKAPDVSFLNMAEEIVRAHHEWFDGSGYPSGLQGQGIPLSARMVALADVYDALTTERVYKKAVSHDEATKIIRKGCGLQFDPQVVEAFLACEPAFRRLAVEMGDRPNPNVEPKAVGERLAASAT